MVITRMMVIKISPLPIDLANVGYVTHRDAKDFQVPTWLSLAAPRDDGVDLSTALFLPHQGEIVRCRKTDVVPTLILGRVGRGRHIRVILSLAMMMVLASS